MMETCRICGCECEHEAWCSKADDWRIVLGGFLIAVLVFVASWGAYVAVSTPAVTP